MPEPDYQREGISLYRGDCLDILPQFRGETAQVVVADPPYGINTKSDGYGKLNPWADLCNAAHWYAMWLGQLRRIVCDSGCVWSFLNWRSLVTFQKAACDLRWSIDSLLVWDKEWIGPGGPRGLRPSYECIALWGQPSFAIPDRGLPDIRRCKRVGYKPTGHPAEKPVELIEWLIGNTSSAGDVVIDPFFGSGSTCIAAIRQGRSFIGCEMDNKWFDNAVKRIDAELSQGRLFSPPTVSKE